jgi:hypothetical protein
MELPANEMLTHSAVCKTCGKTKTGLLLDDDVRYDRCACGGELTDHKAVMQRIDARGVWKEAGPMRWDDAEGKWVHEES